MSSTVSSASSGDIAKSPLRTTANRISARSSLVLTASSAGPLRVKYGLWDGFTGGVVWCLCDGCVAVSTRCRGVFFRYFLSGKSAEHGLHRGCGPARGTPTCCRGDFFQGHIKNADVLVKWRKLLQVALCRAPRAFFRIDSVPCGLRQLHLAVYSRKTPSRLRQAQVLDRKSW